MNEGPNPGSYRGPHQEVLWGSGCLDLLPERIAAREWSRVTVVTGRTVSRSQLLQRTVDLVATVATVSVWAEVREHCPRHTVVEGVRMVDSGRPSALLAIGGGSAIDTACAIADAAGSGTPVVAVPTTFSQAEFTDFVGITEANGEKLVRRAPALVPSLVLLDPDQLTETPASLRVLTGIKAIESSIAGLVQQSGGLLGRPLELEALATMLRLLPALPSGDEEQLLAFHVATWIAVFGRFHGPHPSSIAAPKGWLGSPARHQIGAASGAAHASISAVLLPGLLAFHQDDASEDLDRVSRALGFGSIDALRAHLADLWEALGIPTSLRELGITEAHVRTAHHAMLLEQPALRPRRDDILRFLLAMV